MKITIAPLLLSLVLAAPAVADNAPPSTGPVVAAPGPVPAPPAPAAPASTEQQWSKISVQSIKPTLSARNSYVIRGMHNNGVRGGWTVETSYAINQDTKTVQITVAAHAPKGAVATRDLAPLEAKVEIKELAGAQYSGARGKYDVLVVDRDGKELTRTLYEVK